MNLIKKRSKKAQFYIISAVIIIFIIIGFAIVTNYVAVKKTPEKFYDIGRDLGEGEKVVEQAEYTSGNVQSQMDSYIQLFADYISLYPEENFNMMIIYGNIQDGKINVRKYNTTSTGGVRIIFGGMPIGIAGQGTLSGEQGNMQVNPDNTVNVTLKSGNNTVITRVPVLQGNNFAFVMTTSSNFTSYINQNIAVPEEQRQE